jgi:hypothetical protein
MSENKEDKQKDLGKIVTKSVNIKILANSGSPSQEDLMRSSIFHHKESLQN